MAGVHLVKARVRDLFQQLRQDLLVGDIVHAQALVFKLGLEHCAAALDILLAALLFEPLLYLRARRAAFCDIEPVAARPGGVFRGSDLDDIAVLQHIVEVNDPAVYGRSDHAVADCGMDAVSKVYGRCAGREIYNVALW